MHDSDEGKGEKGIALGVELTQKYSKQSKSKQNMVIFEGSGCVTLMRIKADKIVALGGQLTKKNSKTVKSNGPFKVRRLCDSDEDQGDTGVAFGSRMDSKIFKNGQGLNKIWTFSRGEVV